MNFVSHFSHYLAFTMSIHLLVLELVFAVAGVGGKVVMLVGVGTGTPPPSPPLGPDGYTTHPRSAISCAPGGCLSDPAAPFVGAGSKAGIHGCFQLRDGGQYQCVWTAGSADAAKGCRTWSACCGFHCGKFR